MRSRAEDARKSMIKYQQWAQQLVLQLCHKVDLVYDLMQHNIVNKEVKSLFHDGSPSEGVKFFLRHFIHTPVHVTLQKPIYL